MKASQNDYEKFKKLLQFFVEQVEKNAEAKKAEEPTINKKIKLDKDIGKYIVKDNPEFREYYNLELDFNIIAGLDLIIRFSLNKKFEPPRTTYINIGLLNIGAEFKNKKITALQNSIIIDNPNDRIIGDSRNQCIEHNKKLNPRSIKNLGIDKGNNDPPTPSLKEMLDEYIETYNEFKEILMRLVGQECEKKQTLWLPIRYVVTWLVRLRKCFSRSAKFHI